MSESTPRPTQVEHFDCEGCGKPTNTGEKGFLWFFGNPYCPECRKSMTLRDGPMEGTEVTVKGTTDGLWGDPKFASTASPIAGHKPEICGNLITNQCVLASGHKGWCSHDTPYVTIRDLRARLAEAERLIGVYQNIADGRGTKIEALREALRIARQYVVATHGAVAGAVGQNNLISPDLAAIDAALAAAVPLEIPK